MKKLLLIAFLAPSLLFAQDDSTENNKKFVRFVSISAYVGIDFYRDGFEDRTIFQQAAPNSTLAFANLAGYTNHEGFFYSFYSNVAMTKGINVNLRLRCQQKFGELRFGIAQSNVNVASQFYYKEDITRIGSDTLSNGVVFYTDSVSRASYNYNWNASIIHLHLGWIVRTDPKRWLNLYTGFGIFGGLGFNGVISASHVHTSHIESYSSNNNYSSYSSQQQTTIDVSEKFRAPSFTSIGAYIPIGMNIRLGRRNPFLKHVTLFGEYNGAVQFIMPKGMDPKTRTISSSYGGVRWYIHAPGGGRHRRGHRNGYSHGEEHLQH